MLVALLVVCALRPVLSYSKGAPLSSCKEMVPRHRKGPTYTHHNFQLVVDTGVLEGRVTVRLLTLNRSVKFRGFLIRAMAIKGKNKVYLRGLFEKDAKFQDSLYLDCDGHEKNAVSHGDNKGKTEQRPEMNAVRTGSVLIATIFVVGIAAKVGPYKERVFRTKVDHFGFHNNETFEMRYAVADQFWDSKSGPIFFYAGNEFFMESFMENTGLMWEWAPEMKALIIFTEHRFYGKSMPFGQESLKSKLSADYADFLIHIKGTLPGAANSPIVAFGGSYGGMLAAWMRMKYPHLVTAALSSSAPLLMFPGLSPCSAFDRAITYAYDQGGPICTEAVRKSWAIIESKFTSEESVNALRNKFKLCQELRSSDYVRLRDWLHDVYMVLAMLNYVDASTLLTPLPAHPVREACKFFQRGFASDDAIVDAVAQMVNLYFNGTGTRSCNDLDIFDLYQTSWRFQVA
ncbi:hypothetical protein MTO96_027413 [Rhipicephalus appendiculatus]